MLLPSSDGGAFPIKIRGEWWVIRMGVPPRWSGEEVTYGETLPEEKIINIFDNHRDDRATVETVLHEVLHASVDSLDETYVRSAALAQVGTLVALGLLP